MFIIYLIKGKVILWEKYDIWMSIHQNTSFFILMMYTLKPKKIVWKQSFQNGVQ